MKDRKLIPSDLGILVTEKLKKHFPEVVSLTYTAEVEEKLDKVAEGGEPWVDVVDDFYNPFVKALVAKLDGDKLEIVGVGRAHQDPSDMQSGAIADISGVVHNCEVALAAAEEQAGIRAKKVVIGIAGELVKGATNTIRYKRPRADKELDEAEMNYIIDKVHKLGASRLPSADGLTRQFSLNWRKRYWVKSLSKGAHGRVQI